MTMTDAGIGLRVSRRAASQWITRVPPPGPGRVVVIAPHPDDETLGAGATVYDLVQQGHDVRIVIVTDGAASHDRAGLAAIRKREAMQAATLLGVTSPPQFLDLPDGQVAGLRESLAARLRSCIEGSVLVIGPRSGDGHPDHEATAEALIEATMGIAEDQRPAVWRYAIWAWQWEGITAAGLAGAGLWVASKAARSKRAAAIAAYGSQTTKTMGRVIVPAPMIADIEGSDEVFWC